MKKLSVLLALFLLMPFAKAQTSGESINVTHYAIHVNELNFTNHTLQGETFVDFTTTADVQQIVLELKRLEVSSVTATGITVADFSQSGDFLTINLASPMAVGHSATLDIIYGGSTFSEMWGGVEWWGQYVYNLGVGFESQPHNLGKTWFPCVDNFTDKATYDVFITTTNDKKAICGGNFVETVDNGNGTSTWHWNTPQEIATYHISFAVGDYELWEDVYHGMERDIPIEVYARPSEMSRVSGTFVHIQEICATLESILGPYPFNRIGYVSTGKGCMEHTDNIALAYSIIDGATTGESYLAHELSHMWSGNKVTCATAGDMWLNEGFAQFWGMFYQTGVYGEQAFQNDMANLVNTISTWCNNVDNWLPLNNMPLDLTYDTKAVYERGAVIVNTMMNYMGREKFLSAMRAYFNEYAYQTATSEQLCEALTRYSGIDMQGFFDTYVYSSGMPHLYAAIESVSSMVDQYQYDVLLSMCYQHIGDSHIGQDNACEVTFIGPDFQMVTERVCWSGLYGNAVVTLDFEPVGVVNDLNNNWLDGRTQKNYMLKGSNTVNFASMRTETQSMTDSVFVAVENHLVGPYNDPLIPYLNLSTSHFWTVTRYDFGEADVTAMFDYNKTKDGDIIHSENDSVTLLYRRNASQSWHEIPYTLYLGSTWKNGRFVVNDFPSGEYTIATWNKEGLGLDELTAPEKQLSLYPNPSNGDVRVCWNGVFDGWIQVVGVDGKVLKKVSFTQAESVVFSTEDLANGCYTVVRLDKNGTVLSVEKLIVK